MAEEPKATKHTNLNYISRKRTQLRKSPIVRPSFLGTVAKAVEDSYSFDIFAKAGPYRALVLRVDDKVAPPPNNPLTSISSFFGFFTETKVLAIKAKIIDDFDTALPMPSALGNDDGPHQKIINLHDTFFASTEQTNNADAIKAGDIVLVDYMDRVNKSEGIIVGLTSVSSPLDGFGTILEKLRDLLKDVPGLDSIIKALTPDEGECGGKVLSKSPCDQTTQIKYSGVYETNQPSKYQEIVNKLEILKNNKWIADFSAVDLDSVVRKEREINGQKFFWDEFDTSDKNGIITIDYDWTLRARCDGHPEWCKTLEAALKLMADYYIELGEPEKAGMIQVGNTKRSAEEQQSLRVLYCVPADDPRCPAGKRCEGKRINGTAISDDDLRTNKDGYCKDPHCSKPVCAGGSVGSHEAGEATDFILAKWPKNSKGQEIYNSIQTIENKIDSTSLAEQFANPARTKLAEFKLTGEVSNFQPISDNSEGWHFSTNGG